MTREVNAAAVAIATSAEGCVLTAYRDPAGVVTAGFGHTGPDVVLGKTYTMEQALAWRAADMARAAAFVEAHVKVTLNDNQFSALAEFTYNVGVGNFLGSTLLRLLNQGQYNTVPAQLMRWTKAGGKDLPGLVRRRQKEIALWLGPYVQSNLTRINADIAQASPTAATVGKASAPSLLERIRAWLSGGDRLATPAVAQP